MLAVQGAPQSKTDAVSADAVVLPNTFLGSYAALAHAAAGQDDGRGAARLHRAAGGSHDPASPARRPKRIETPKGAIQATHYALTFNNPPPAGDLVVNLWADAGRPAAAHEHSDADDRDGARRHRVRRVAHRRRFRSRRRERDDSRASASTSPARSPSRRPTSRSPAVILIAGSGPTDRDETVAGIPVFGHIARDLVAAGFFVVRYDKRGVGQSGGRAESVTIADYAEDARQVLLWLEKRKDVDKDRIALVGHSEGGAGRDADRRPGARQGRGARAARRPVDQRQRGRARTAEATCCRRCRSTMRSGRRRWRCRKRSTPR